ASDIELNSNVALANPDEVLAHLTAKNAELEIEIKVERGLGYVASEARKTEGRLPIGTVALDAIFTPVQRVNFIIEDMRVGVRTDFNRLRLEIGTDGTISPSSALHKASKILQDHFDKVAAVEVKEFDLPKAEGEGAAKKTKKKKEE